jgi:hypothetical protein
MLKIENRKSNAPSKDRSLKVGSGRNASLLQAFPAPTPTNSDEYQTKGLTKVAIRKRLILKDAILVVWGRAKGEMAA